MASDVKRTLQGATATGHSSGNINGAAGNNSLVDSKREAEKLLKSKASSYTTVKQKTSNLMEILQEDGSLAKSGGKADPRKRDRKR